MRKILLILLVLTALMATAASAATYAHVTKCKGDYNVDSRLANKIWLAKDDPTCSRHIVLEQMGYVIKQYDSDTDTSKLLRIAECSYTQYNAITTIHAVGSTASATVCPQKSGATVDENQLGFVLLDSIEGTKPACTMPSGSPIGLEGTATLQCGTVKNLGNWPQRTDISLPKKAVSAQPWTTRLSQIYQCNSGTPMSIWQTSYGGMNYDCSDVRAKLDPYDPKLYLLTENYVKENNLLASTNKIIQCSQNWLTQSTPSEWGFLTSSTEPCLVGKTDTAWLKGYSLKQKAPGTNEVFLCTNNQRPFTVYSISTDPNCRSSNNDRKGYIKVASLGFWPQSTDYVYKAPVQISAPSPTTAQSMPEIGPKTLTACVETLSYVSGKDRKPIDNYYVTTGPSCSTPTQPGGRSIGVHGVTIDSKEPDTVLLMQCEAPFRTGADHMVSLDPKCEGTNIRGPLGYAYKTQKTGTIPLRRCVYTANGDHYTTTGQCEAAKDEGILGYLNPVPTIPKEPEICCMITTEKGDRKANVMQKTQCEEEAKKMGGKYTTSPKEECEKEICCTYDGRYEWDRYGRCYERKGTIADRTREKCRQECGNGIIEHGEACEKSADCKPNYECKNCQCIEICPIKQADNDALLAQLSVLEKRNKELRERKICGILERKEKDKVEINICNNLGECVIEGKQKGLTLLKLYADSTCKAR